MEQKLPNIEHRLATAERRVLIQIVKLAQKQKLEGENGEWKDFLAVHDKKHGANLSDPERRNNDVLIKFLMTFKNKEHLQLIAKILQCDANRNLIEKFKNESSDKETPEQRLVRMTITHPEYPLSYTFPSHGDDWYVSGTGKKKNQVLKNRSMIAIDCEMVECEDGKDAVVRVAAVDRDLESLLNVYVKPHLPVVDYRTQITGITAEDLEKAKLSVSDVQKKLTRFLSKGAILVGHGLHNDLNVLKIDHARVIDTSLVFNYCSSSKRPGLNGLCKSVLGYELRKDETVAHDCLHDAIAAMKLVLAVVEKGVDTSVAETQEMIEAQKTKLLLHKIPHNLPSEELQAAITGDFTLNVKPGKQVGGFYSAVANFSSSEDANRAFDKVNGDVVQDRFGLPQKLVEFKLSSGTGASLYVRKMVPDLTTVKANPEEEENNDNMRSKIQKREEDDEEEVENRREEDKKKLLLHKIASNVTSQELHLAITGDFKVDVRPAKKLGGFYSAVAIFNSSEEANRAFVNIEGEVAKDRSGLPQKLAEFKLSSGTESSLYVRKMVEDSEISSVVTTEKARVEEDDELKSKLLIHKIPHKFSSQELQSAITGDFTVDVQPSKKKGGFYSVIAVFKSSKEANLAFDNIGGSLVKDRSGLPQKLAVFKMSSGTEASLFVRKMVRDSVVTTKRAHPEEEEEENNMSSKRQKKEDEEDVNRCENLLKVIEELKEKVKETLKSSDHQAKEIQKPEEKLKDDDHSEIEELKSKLLIHRIPHNFPSQELKSTITGDFKVDVQPPKKKGGCYSVIAIFKSSEEANHVFDNINGDIANDRAGLPQKLALFKTSSGTEASLFVRKMVKDGVVTTKRAHPEEEEEEEKNVSSKRQKREEEHKNRCEVHLKKIEALKEKEVEEKNVSSKRQETEEDYKNRCENLSKEIEELKEKLKVKETEKSCDHHAKEIQELEQKLKAKDFQIKTQDKMITNLKEKLDKKKPTKSKSSR